MNWNELEKKSIYFSLDLCQSKVKLQGLQVLCFIYIDLLYYIFKSKVLSERETTATCKLKC